MKGSQLIISLFFSIKQISVIRIFLKQKLKIMADSGIIKIILPKKGEFVWIRF